MGFILLLAVILAAGRLPSRPAARPFHPASRPWLGMLVDDHSSGLSPAQQQAVQRLAEREAHMVQRLQAESDDILADPALSLEQKRSWVRTSQYNQRLETILNTTQRQLRQALGRQAYGSLVSQAEQAWQAAQLAAQINQAGGRSRVGWSPDFLLAQDAKTYPRSFEVYATRYDAGDRYIVALPDKCLKFANSGAMRCSDGYQYHQDYSVAISYQGKMVVATVLESGPWNIDDNYWSKANDPQPRRMFTDLPLGVPAAQAAYFNGYNQGLDQFGRTVTSPVAIDISYKVAKDLGLPSGNNKVTVSFLWTAGWDEPARQTSSAGQAAGEPAGPAVIGYVRATPAADGQVVHVVQPGQTLSGIAKVYQVELSELLELNHLALQSILQPGDRIVVAAGLPVTSSPAVDPAVPGQAASATAPPRLTATLPAGELLLAATRTAAREPPAVSPDAQADQQGIAGGPGPADSLAMLLVIALLASAALFAAWAWWKSR